MKYLVKALWILAIVIAAVFACIGLVLGGLFLVPAGALLVVSEDLEGAWRRGSKQNALWRWARKYGGNDV